MDYFRAMKAAMKRQFDTGSGIRHLPSAFFRVKDRGHHNRYIGYIESGGADAGRLHDRALGMR